jgi:hypothetical protein
MPIVHSYSGKTALPLPTRDYITFWKLFQGEYGSGDQRECRYLLRKDFGFLSE